MKKYKASIDIGSNTVVYLIVGNNEIIERGQFVTSLGLDLDKNQIFSKVPMQETMEALKEICTKAKSFNINEGQIVATATEASRVARNGKEFYQKVLREVGLKVEIIDSDKEAYYSAQGVCFDKERKSFICLDIGGASTEFIKKSSSPESINSISLPVGSVRLLNWKNETTDQEKLKEVFSSFDFSSFQTSKVIGVAGTMTALCMMIKKLDKFVESEINNQEISKDEVISIYGEIKNLNSVEILSKYPHLGKRSKVIKEGIEIILRAMDEINAKKIEVSTRGVCFGTINGLNY